MFFEKVLHRDFLGAVLGCGVSREGVGDLKVLKEGGGAEVIVRTEIGEALMGIDQVGGVKVDVEIIIGKTSDISKTEREMKEVVTTEASLRVDAVGSGGLGVPRSRVTELARNGAVFVNYRAVTGGKCVKEGDVVSVRGVGKVVIGSCTRTRKGRFRIEMKKYV